MAARKVKTARKSASKRKPRNLRETIKATNQLWRGYEGGSTGSVPAADIKAAMEAAWKACGPAGSAYAWVGDGLDAALSESAKRAAYDNLQAIQRVGVAKPAPATEAALNDLQMALSNLGSEVIQLRNELELVLQPSGPRATADGCNALGEPPRSPLTRRIRSMIGDANGTADMLRDIRDRLEMGPQETPF